MNKPGLVAVLAFACTVFAQTQQKPNFSGTWKLDPLRSRFSGIPEPKSAVVTMAQNEPKLHVDISTESKQATKHEAFDVTTDGTEEKTTIDGQPATVSAAWDGNDLVVTENRDTPNGPVAVTRRWRMGDKGKVAWTILTMKDKNGEKSAYGFYVKQ